MIVNRFIYCFWFLFYMLNAFSCALSSSSLFHAVGRRTTVELSLEIEQQTLEASLELGTNSVDGGIQSIQIIVWGNWMQNEKCFLRISFYPRRNLSPLVFSTSSSALTKCDAINSFEFKLLASDFGSNIIFPARLAVPRVRGVKDPRIKNIRPYYLSHRKSASRRCPQQHRQNDQRRNLIIIPKASREATRQFINFPVPANNLRFSNFSLWLRNSSERPPKKEFYIGKNLSPDRRYFYFYSLFTDFNA